LPPPSRPLTTPPSAFWIAVTAPVAVELMLLTTGLGLVMAFTAPLPAPDAPPVTAIQKALGGVVSGLLGGGKSGLAGLLGGGSGASGAGGSQPQSSSGGSGSSAQQLLQYLLSP
jgi:hypothetical protein